MVAGDDARAGAPTENPLDAAIFPALTPLNPEAARETFITIADPDYAEDDLYITELLALTGNLPLAVCEQFNNRPGDLRC